MRVQDDQDVNFNGNVGTGEAFPDARLHIASDDSGDELIVGEDLWDIKDESTRVLIGSDVTGTNAHAVVRLGINSSHFANIIMGDTSPPVTLFNAVPADDNDIAIQSGSSYGNVGIGTMAPARKLHISDTMRLEPRSSAPSSPSAGDIYVDSTPAADELCFYDGSAWQGISSGTDGNCA